MSTRQQRIQMLTRILFIGMLSLGILGFVFSFIANLIPSIESFGYWLTSLGIGLMLWGGIGLYYTRGYQVGSVSVGRYANSGMEIIMLSGIAIFGLSLVVIGIIGFFNWLRTI